MEASLGGLLAAPSEEVSAAEATEALRTRSKRIRFSIAVRLSMLAFGWKRKAP